MTGSVVGIRGRWVGALALVALIGASQVRAQTVVGGRGDAAHEPGAEPGAEPASFHWTATIGWFGAISGPLVHGPSAQVELLPGGAFGRFGVGLYYRGDEQVRRGLVLLGAVYEAGASRPGLVMSLHAAAGYDAANALPVVGTGLRIQLGVSGPLILSSNLTMQLFLDGLDTRLGMALGLTAGLAR